MLYNAIYGNMDPINIPQMLIYIYSIHGSYGLEHLTLNQHSEHLEAPHCRLKDSHDQ